MARAKQGGTRAAAQLARLKAPPPYTDDQLDYAAATFEEASDPAVIRAAMAVLGAGEHPRLRRMLLARFRQLAGDPPRRDQGGVLRADILRTLRPVLHAADIPLLEQATMGYEFLATESAAGLRAAALIALNEVDDRLAGYHAVRLLTDQHTSIMSGEPAITAARVLAAQGQLLPLYGHVLREGAGIADVVAECLRSLVPLPATLLPPLVERYLAADDEIVLLGLFDLLLARPDRDAFRDDLLDFLRETRLHNSYRYLVSAIVASRDASFIAALATLQRAERDRQKLALLGEALALR